MTTLLAAPRAPGHGAHLMPSMGKARYENRPNHQRAFPLSENEINRFQRDGVLIVRSVFSAEEMRSISEEVDHQLQEQELIDPHNLRFEWGATAEAGPWKVDPFLDLSAVLGAFGRDRRICDRLASLYDGYEPRIFKDKFIIKPAGSHGSGLHRDYTWWQGFPVHSLISVAVAVDGADRENGSTQLFPGSNAGYLPPEHQMGCLKDDQTQGIEPIYFDCQPGDIAFFHSTVLHRACENKSTRSRKQIFLTYNDSRDGEHYLEHREHFWGYRLNNFNQEQAESAYFK